MSSGSSVIESGQRLSESVIWDLQRRFYAHQGIEAWKSGVVPSYITSNAFIAHRYARLMHHYMLEWRSKNEGDQPFYIVELGAGHGRFSYMALKSLLRLRKECPVPGAKFVYVMTDFAQKNVEFWRMHSDLRPFVDAGVLDFAQFDAENSTSLKLLESEKEISTDTLETPVIVIANYIFDSLKQDVFRVREGILEESRIALIHTGEGEVDFENGQNLKDLSMQYEDAEAVDNPYGEDRFNAILKTYKENLGDTAFCFPVGTLRAIQTFESFTDAGVMIISSDKGYSHMHQLLGNGGPSLARHGSVSFMVNYHALSLYFQQGGGFALTCSERAGSIETCAFISQGSPQDFMQTCLSFKEGMDEHGPVDFFLLKNKLKPDNWKPSLKFALSMVRLSAYDPETFYVLRHSFRDGVEDISSERKREVYRTMMHVSGNFYPLGEDRDIPFAIGRILHRMDYNKEAIHFYQRSLDICGIDRATYYNMGLCYHRLGQNGAAIHHFDKALEQDANYGSARDWRMRVQAEMAGEGLPWQG